MSGYPGGHKGLEPASKSVDYKTRKKLADALDERANRAASAGGFGWEKVVDALREAADDLRDGKL